MAEVDHHMAEHQNKQRAKFIFPRHSLGCVDAPLHSDLVPWFEDGGRSRGGVGVAQDLHVGKPDPVGSSLSLPHTLDVQVMETIVVQLVREREREREMQILCYAQWLTAFTTQICWEYGSIKDHTHCPTHLGDLADISALHLLVFVLTLDQHPNSQVVSHVPSIVISRPKILRCLVRLLTCPWKKFG